MVSLLVALVILALKLAALLALSAYFLRKRLQRLPRLPKRAAEIQWTGKAFDVRTVAGRVRRLRQDYLADVATRSSTSWERQLLVAEGRPRIKRCSFFQNLALKQESERDDEAPGHA